MPGLLNYTIRICLLSFLIVELGCFNLPAQRYVEKLSRGLVAIPNGENHVYLSWRLLKDDPDDISFNVYRATHSEKPEQLNVKPIRLTTGFTDSSVILSRTNRYIVRPLIDGIEHPESDAEFELAAGTSPKPYLSVKLQVPPGGKTRDGLAEYHYIADDGSVGDLDGDGSFEIVQKWVATGKGKSPYWGPTIFDAYKLDGTLMWRINMGINCNPECFLVYDMDCDGKAEFVVRTADGTISGKGEVVGDALADWVVKAPPVKGHVVAGPEYYTVFDGQTGGVLATDDYFPTRYPLDGWGGVGGNGGNDKIGNRANKFLSAVAYLDGKTPSIIQTRGYFGRIVIVASDYKNRKLTRRWVFDTGSSYPPYKDASPYSGMGNHNLTIADVDNDGKDEIIFGSMVVDDNGKGMFSMGFRHGDAIHVGDLDPSHPGLEVFGPHENEGGPYDSWGATLYGAGDGKVLFAKYDKVDVGRGVSEDIDPRHPGAENWGGPEGLRDYKGNTISENGPCSQNFLVWWDADHTRELLDQNRIDKWNWNTSQSETLLQDPDCMWNNGTKAVPVFSGDILGDWREEVIWRTKDSRELRIYSTSIPAKDRLVTFLQDPQYRLSLVWQNVGYNQPPHLSFSLGGK